MDQHSQMTTPDELVVDEPAVTTTRGQRIASRRIYAEHPEHGSILVAAEGQPIPPWYDPDVDEVDFDRKRGPLVDLARASGDVDDRLVKLQADHDLALKGAQENHATALAERDRLLGIAGDEHAQAVRELGERDSRITGFEKDLGERDSRIAKLEKELEAAKEKELEAAKKSPRGKPAGDAQSEG